jgi:hypothetical protein
MALLKVFILPVAIYLIDTAELWDGSQTLGAGTEGVDGIHRREPESITPSDVALASWHLSRYFRSAAERKVR